MAGMFEKGVMYDVLVKDDGSIEAMKRADMLYIDEDDEFVKFFNAVKKKEEILPKKNIVSALKQ